MFGKKKQPSPSSVLQVLTAAHLVEGTFEGDSPLLYFSKHDQLVLLPLTSVQIQATGPVDLPTRTCAKFVVVGCNVVALIPRVEITQIAEYEMIRKLNKNPLPGVFYIGPYVIEGKLMLQIADLFENPMFMVDVHITSRVPGARWGGLDAPFASVNTRLLDGYEPR